MSRGETGPGAGPEVSRIAPDVKLGQGVRIVGFVKPHGCEIGQGSKIGTFVGLQEVARSVGSGAVILCGVTIGEGSTDVEAFTVAAGNPGRLLRRPDREPGAKAR